MLIVGKKKNKKLVQNGGGGRGTKQDILLLENNKHWGGNSTSTLHWKASHHPVVDYLHIIAGLVMFYSLLIICTLMYTVG